MRGAAQKQRTALGNIAESGQAVPHAGPVLPRVAFSYLPGRTIPARVGERPCGAGNAAVPPNKKKEVQPITSKSHEDEFIRTERFQISCGRVIRVVSVFPKQGTETPADKLKALAELEFQQGKMCA